MASPKFDSPAAEYFRKNYLWPEEKVLWAGQPARARVLMFNAWFCVVGCFLCVFLFLIWRSIPDYGDIRLPEALLGFGSLWLALTPLRYLWRGSRTAYFVTDQRAVILEKGLRVRETVFHPADITEYKLIRRSGDRGDIQLRVSKNRASNPYQEDKQRWVPGNLGTMVTVSSTGSFLSYNDGFWGADHISEAAVALNDIRLSAERDQKFRQKT
ncbi:hypothetical protein NBZ79_00865 [Sneathiella marina]|uniref:DUF304 domain-containing protein n=1 Tax=Sneathiella marina TaxID=2950108 RepID=A0ABY4W2V5_9PROT|nr:hypothetical protein [Sneathiella marina]USG61527.1 hypothetical protein NBZ79_00865 [Sneathiella marina]